MRKKTLILLVVRKNERTKTNKNKNHKPPRTSCEGEYVKYSYVYVFYTVSFKFYALASRAYGAVFIRGYSRVQLMRNTRASKSNQMPDEGQNGIADWSHSPFTAYSLFVYRRSHSQLSFLMYVSWEWQVGEAGVYNYILL